MIDESVLEKLEFFKVLNHISNYSITELGKKYILDLKPSSKISSILQEGKIINEAKEIIIKTGYPPIDYLSDLTKNLSESKIEGAVLSGQKINEILRLAKTSRLLYQFIKKESESNSYFNDIFL